MMEEEIVSILSNDRIPVMEEVSDSNSITHQSPASKRARGTSKFKGVVPQHNGHWGCQIYANHQRIWLGTFKSEKEAAVAYDSAALKLRSGDSHRNMPVTSITAEEPTFQIYYSTETVLNMIKDGTYLSKLAEFVRTHSPSEENGFSPARLVMAKKRRGMTCRQLFQKELTPSDVGKLNRLVIPKKHAVKFLPQIAESIEENEADDKSDDTLLAFYDRSMKLWKFRYCYWKSSQSYVFTRGWNRFVKEKQLKANDSVVISLCESRENAGATGSFYMIDVNHGESSNVNHGENSNVVAEAANKMEVQLQTQLGHSVLHKDSKTNIGGEGLMDCKLTHDAEMRGFKLFGVQII